MYSFHITFADGSNPYYHFPCEYSKHYRALRKWRKSYFLAQTARFKVKGGGYTVFFTATPYEHYKGGNQNGQARISHVH